MPRHREVTSSHCPSPCGTFCLCWGRGGGGGGALGWRPWESKVGFVGACNSPLLSRETQEHVIDLQ